MKIMMALKAIVVFQGCDNGGLGVVGAADAPPP
jgi:hypothetical protein